MPKAKKTTKPKKVKASKPKKVVEKQAPVIVEANAPMTAPAMQVVETTEAVEVKSVKKAKKPKKTIAKDVWHFDPPVVEWKRKSVDDGWKNYRLWTKYELEYDDDGTEEDNMKSIAKGMAKSKTALMNDLNAFDTAELVVKTVLKKDAFPYEPFIEAWVAIDKERAVLEKLVELSSLTVIDPDYSLTVEEVEDEDE